MACKEGFNKGTKLSYLDRLSHSVWYQHFYKASNTAFHGSSKLSYTKESLLIMELLSIVTQGLLVKVALSSSTLNLSWTLFNGYPYFSLYVFKKGVPRSFHSTAHSHGLLCFSNQGRKWSNHDKDLARFGNLCSKCCWFSSDLSAGQWNLSTSPCLEHTKRLYGVFCQVFCLELSGLEFDLNNSVAFWWKL